MHDKKGFSIFKELLILFLSIKFTNIKRENIYFLLLDSSNNQKFSRHVIVRILRKYVEYMFYSNNQDLSAFINKFRDFLVTFVYNNNADENLYSKENLEFRHQLIKFTKNVDQNEELMLLHECAN